MLMADVQLSIIFCLIIGIDLFFRCENKLRVAQTLSLMEKLARLFPVTFAVVFDEVHEQTLWGVTVVAAATFVLSLGHGGH